MKRRYLFRLITLFFILALASGQIALGHFRYKLSTEAEALRHERQQLQMELKRLQIEKASLVRPERLREWARKLHMAPPSPSQVVRL